MRTNFRAVVIVTALSIGALVLLGWQRQTERDLRGEIARQRIHATEQARLTAEHRQAEARATAEELDQVLAERAAVAQLRKELDALHQKAETMAGARQGAETEKAPPSLLGHVLGCSLWRNLGRATPVTALETALWASVNGDIDTLANLLVFDSEARSAATSLFAHLPEKLRQEFGSPERLVAILAAKDVPLGSATILNEYPASNETKLSVQIFDAEGKHKMALLSLRPDDAGWRFVVPTNAVKRYAAWLQAPPSVALSPVTVGGKP